MRTLAVMNASALTEYAFMPFADGPSAFERAVAVLRGLAADEDILVLAKEGAADQARAYLPSAARLESLGSRATMRAVLDAVASFAATRAGAELAVYAHGDAPFLDKALAERLIALHRKYRAEYTYADGYPAGFAPEILSTRVLPNLAELAGRHDAPAERDGLFAVIQKDINSYDIETELSPLDLRSYRLSPVCDTRRNFMAAEALHAEGCRSAEDAVRIVPERPGLLRTVPAFLWVQIAEACPQACSYCPYPRMVGDPRGKAGFMPPERFEALMADAEALCDDLVVDLSLWGEPALHPDFKALAESVLKRPRFSLIVETSGVGWRPGVAESVAAMGGGRAHWIVSLDDPDDEGYRALRGEGRAEAEAFARSLAALAPGQVNAQAVRMRGNEERLESFYRGWKKDIEKVIIQKYDSFSGALPELSVADLSPLERFPCRHLARDMAVLLDGTVPACKHCLVPGSASAGVAPAPLAYAQAFGNAFGPGGLRAAWDAMGAWYRKHAEGAYPDCCERCDEYHTFNA